MKNGKNVNNFPIIFFSSLYTSILEKIFKEIRYHPILENFPEYESLKREPVPYNEADKFVIPNLMMPGMEV